MTKELVVFGEVLFDQFEDGTAVLGGAPFNVAWHLNGFGLAPTFISRVGDDALGQTIRSTMQQWDMNQTGLQTDTTHPTGTVTVKLVDGQPAYTIEPDQAYDVIDKTAAEATVDNRIPANTDFLLYHGSLIMRSEGSRKTLEALVYDYEPAVFIDINLRKPWWDQASVEQAMDWATWIKLNDDELRILSGQAPESREEYLSIAQAFCIQYGLEFVVLTMGAEGAAIVSDSEIEFAAVPQSIQVADTVGAGDGFSSVVIMGLANGWPKQKILQHAIEFAAEVCKVTGATIQDRSLYESKSMAWQG